MPCRGEEANNFNEETMFLEVELLLLAEQTFSNSSTDECSTPLALMLRSLYILIPSRIQSLKNVESMTLSGLVVVVLFKRLHASVNAMEVHALLPRVSLY